jgi:hypothetical protein
MSKLKLGDRALPKLTDTFPEPRSWSMSGRLSSNISCKEGGLSLATQCSRDSQEIAWRDHSEESAWQGTIKAKNGSKTCAGSATTRWTSVCAFIEHGHNKDIEFCDVRKVWPLAHVAELNITPSRSYLFKLVH